MQRSKLTAIALVSLLSFALLASYLANGHGRYSFDGTLLRSLGSPSSVDTWARWADLLAAPAIIAVLVASFAWGVRRRCVVRIGVYTACATVTFLTSELVAKPLVHETHYGQLTFPSGNVTAVCATAVAMWLALHPLLGELARRVTFLLGAAWVVLMSVAVVGAQWHTLYDALGSVLLSLGIITAGGAVYERSVPVPRGPTGTVDEDAPFVPAEDDAALTSSVRGR